MIATCHTEIGTFKKVIGEGRTTSNHRNKTKKVSAVISYQFLRTHIISQTFSVSGHGLVVRMHNLHAVSRGFESQNGQR